LRYCKVKINGRTKQLSRHLMEQHLGRPLARNEHVHHKNEDKLDDRLDNYELTDPASHNRHHKQIHPISKRCVICGAEFTPHKTKRKRQQTCSKSCANALRSRTEKATKSRNPPAMAQAIIEANFLEQRVEAVA